MRSPASSQFLRRIEAIGIRRAQYHWARMPPHLAHRLKPRVALVGDGLLTLAGGSDALLLNRVIGLGHRGKATKGMIDEIIAIYGASRLRRFSFVLGPGTQAGRISGWLLARGFRRRGGYSVLVRDCREPVPPAPGGIRVARARRAQASVIVAIHERSFGVPASRRSWLLAAATAGEEQHYLAYAGTTPVAVASLRVDGDLAWLGGAATLTRWRRRGAHRALIVARLRQAARRGCRWAWVETILPARGRPAGSRRNLLRLGFAEACERRTFVWGPR